MRLTPLQGDCAPHNLASRLNCWTIVIPTYNRAKYLPDALRSVFAQGVAGTQVTVVDDGSTDGTREVVSRFGGRVQYVYQKNRGPSAAKNCGICLARGKFISFLDSDDVSTSRGFAPSAWNSAAAGRDCSLRTCTTGSRANSSPPAA
ncbi:MAG: hypothetical protein DME97_05170 [Verrucomicrobia bacterium]|nr:MAG: hypothetical protein DME97_05170 [Verrucomicrobiota bacterium]